MWGEGFFGEIFLEGSYCGEDIKIPFNNMLELIKHFLHLAYTSDMEKLSYFLMTDDGKDLQKKTSERWEKEAKRVKKANERKGN